MGANSDDSGCEKKFTSTDYAIVRSAVRKLPGVLAKVIELRFWQHYTVLEISEILGISEIDVNSAINRSYLALRDECLRNPVFSRSLCSALRRNDLKWSA